MDRSENSSSIIIPDLARVAKAAAAHFQVDVTSEWYCDRSECDGKPHGEWTKKHARTKQRPPTTDDDWFVWMLMAGRGFGKTRAGAEWLAYQARKYPRTQWGAIGRTIEQTRTVCFEGESGLLDCLGLSITSHVYNRTTGEITLPNGSRIYKFSAENPDSMIGHNLHGAWCDELGTWHYKEAWDRGLIFAIRKSPDGKLRPHIVVTTTPRNIGLVKELKNAETTRLTYGSTYENVENLSVDQLAEFERKYGHGSRLGRQELYGELLEDVPGALWTDDLIESTTILNVPGMKPALFASKED